MFSPGTKRSSFSARKERNPLARPPPQDSPVTPLGENRSSIHNDSIPNRPSTGTPAPWAPRLSVLARIPHVKKSEKGDDLDPTQPVYVGEFPQVVRDEQANFLQKCFPGDACFAGGMDKETSLAWIICGSKLFIWCYLSPAASRKYVTLDLPSSISEIGDNSRNSCRDNDWLLCVVSWDGTSGGTGSVFRQCESAGVILSNRKTRAVIYWHDIYSESKTSPVAYTDESEMTSPGDLKNMSNKQRERSRPLSSSTGSNTFNSLVASAIPDTSKLWSHVIIGTDGDSGIQKGLAGQKRIWPLDLQIDNLGKVITILIATFCKDRVSSSSFTEYSILTMQYKSGVSISSENSMHISEKVLEKKAPVQIIIPKARYEEEDFLFSMRLKVGGKPSGSAVILSGDGTATVSHYWRNSTRLYQFDLPYDAGKVLDASIFPSDDGEDGAWVVLTEKAGLWAIPEKAVLLGGVEPPERSLSRKGSSNEGSAQEERRNVSFAGNIAPRRASSEAWDAGDRQRAVFTGIARRTAQDEESEALLSHLFHDFLSSDQVTGAFEKLRNSGAFERDGETNVFARISKSIVDTLAKHWTTTRGAEIVALAVVSSQLMDKQQKHQKFLQFLALSKCHEELRSRQRQSLQIIMEHGEKLASMIQLRELQSMISQRRSAGLGSTYSSSESGISGPLWDLIQLVGDRARRNTVLLMDRDNAEVFYSKVSELEELFYCLDRQLKKFISLEMTSAVQFQRACELSDACVTLLHSAMHYRNEHNKWYPSPEGLTPWYCQTTVRSGLWCVASFMLQLLNETKSLDRSAKLDFHSHLEVLSEVLLEAYSGAITAKVEREEEHKGLLDEYWNRRDALLDALYHQVKSFVDTRHQPHGQLDEAVGENQWQGNPHLPPKAVHPWANVSKSKVHTKSDMSSINVEMSGCRIQDLGEGTEEQDGEVFGKLSSSLLSIARRHEGYQTLWNICCDVNDSKLLRKLMCESMGPRGGFSYFVFKQLYKKKQFSKLMRVGEEFPEELATFLKQHRDLLWLHEVFLHQFSSASDTLHALALSEDSNSISAADGFEFRDTNVEPALVDRRRFLNLSKIAVVAGKDADYDIKLKRIEADLKILILQEEILEVLGDEKQKIGQRLLPPLDLIELCLKSESVDLSLRAFDVLAWTSASFLKCNTSLMEECWRNAANQDNWEGIYQTSIAEGWSDEETLENLRETVLFQASSRCYGPEAETFEGGFDEVLPLRQDNADLSTPKDMISSVEAILTQHKDFPVAGKLMMTAIMLGSVQGNTTEEGPSPME
ncbi:hypothetical protein RJ639_036194 [Escallonia herrerae]|uniref:Nuclear pore complex protein NUP133 n=1 Tax=Escallonia herrerae TaxID=1293975 RepID=A0AA88WRZ4_9ASTE|nr:hypothetical protein RJ639_036194 [Escallonia herrerae]